MIYLSGSTSHSNRIEISVLANAVHVMHQWNFLRAKRNLVVWLRLQSHYLLNQGFQFFLSEGHISHYTTVLRSDILRNVIVSRHVAFYQINKFFVYFIIIDQMSSRTAVGRPCVKQSARTPPQQHTTNIPLHSKTLGLGQGADALRDNRFMTVRTDRIRANQSICPERLCCFFKCSCR